MKLNRTGILLKDDLTSMYFDEIKKRFGGRLLEYVPHYNFKREIDILRERGMIDKNNNIILGVNIIGRLPYIPSKSDNDANLPKAFTIKSDNLLLLEAMILDLKNLGYTDIQPDGYEQYHVKNISKTHALSNDETDHRIRNNIANIDYFKRINNIDCEKSEIDRVIFRLPQQYVEALDFCKKQLDHDYFKSKEIVKYFGENKLTLDLNTATAKSEFGTITYSELYDFVKHIQNTPKILGYEYDINNTVKIGCQTGKLTELIDIIRTLDSKSKI